MDVSDEGRVWGVNRNQDIYRRTGDSWQHIDGIKAIQVSVGKSGVWVVNTNHDIYYRVGTFGDKDTAGTNWVNISGKLKWISSGRNIVVGCTLVHEICASLISCALLLCITLIVRFLGKEKCELKSSFYQILK